MKLHSDIIDSGSLYYAAMQTRRDHGQDFQIGEVLDCGSRKRAHGVSFKGYALTGRYSTNSGIYGADSPRAATWSAWGYLIAELFKVDPHAVIGYYDGVADFERQCRETHAHIAEGRAYDLPRYEIGFLNLLPAEVTQ